MNIEQEREAFKLHFAAMDLTEKPDAWGRPSFKHPHVESLWAGWQARAALQSQDRGDAERYRAWRKAVAAQNRNFMRVACNELPDWDEGPVDESRVDEAIGHARRIEGEGK